MTVVLVDGIEITEEFASRYRLSSLLGAGAVGTVRAATQVATGRAVAIKFLRRLGDPVLTERFLREARMLARVQHPNVLKVFELGEVGGHPYLVTELIRGGTLRHRLMRERKLPSELALRLAVGCLDGLAACHQASFVHRDIKPENILIDEGDIPRIADLGIARSMEVHGGLTMPGTVMGTPRYMSPEQARGDKAGPATDLYAMGVIIYEMLTGDAPFHHADISTLMKMQIKDPPPPLPPGDWPEDLAVVVASALAKAAQERPPSAASFATALARMMPVDPFRDASAAALELARRREPDPVPAVVPEPPPVAAPAAPAADLPLRVRSSRKQRFVPDPPPPEGNVTGELRTVHPAPAPETRPFMIAACIAASVMTFLALEPQRPRRPSPSATPGSAVATLAPASASLVDTTSLILRLDALRGCRTRAEARMVALRAAMEEDRGAAQVADLRVALLEADEDVRLTREFVRELDEAVPAGGPAGPADVLATTTTRALALQWLALSRQCWVRQKLHVLTRPKSASEDWTRLTETGPEAASGAMVPMLRRWLTAAEAQLRRPATMPSIAGPELAELLDEVHAVSTATYVLNWHTSAQPLVDTAAQSFLSGVSRLPGLAAPLIDKIVADLWRWGHAEGAMIAYASVALFEPDRDQTVRRLMELASFLTPPAREAMQRLIARARAGFRDEAARARPSAR